MHQKKGKKKKKKKNRFRPRKTCKEGRQVRFSVRTETVRDRRPVAEGIECIECVEGTPCVSLAFRAFSFSSISSPLTYGLFRFRSDRNRTDCDLRAPETC